MLTGSVLAALGTTLGIGLLALAVAGVRRRPGELGDPTVVPLVLALVAVGTLLSSPVDNGLSRLIETRADVASLEATRDPAAFVRMQRQLDLHSLYDNPPAWSQFWFGSHPTTLQRIAIAEQLGRRMGRSTGRPPAAGSEPGVERTIPGQSESRGSPMDPRPSGPDVRESASAAAALCTGVEGLAGVAEEVVDAATEGVDGDHDDAGDAGDQQAVLDGRGATLSILARRAARMMRR